MGPAVSVQQLVATPRAGSSKKAWQRPWQPSIIEGGSSTAVLQSCLPSAAQRVRAKALQLKPEFLVVSRHG